MKTSIFEYKDYKKFVNDLIDSSERGGRGVRKALAEAIHCQGAFITHVLSGSYHFSLEQAEASSRFFGLSREETEFLLLLVNYNRAGTDSLRAFYEKTIQEKVDVNFDAKKGQSVTENVSVEVQATYYSSWRYAAICMLTTVPEFRTREAIAKRMGLPLAEVTQILQFLTASGLLLKKQQQYQPHQKIIYLKKDSPFIPQHHSAWRQRAIESLDHQREEDLHYSMVLTCAKKDLKKLKARLTTCLEDCFDIIKPSSEETMGALCMDFFEL